MTWPARLLFGFLALSAFSFTASAARAHESQPGTLDLRQVARDRYEVLWRAPIYFGRPHPSRVEFPAEWRTVVGPTRQLLSDSELFRSVVTVGDGGLDGSTVRFPGLERTTTDVFVRLTRLDGTTMTAVVRPSNPNARLRGERPWTATAGEYVALGFHHILAGFDHLLFVLGLILIVRSRTTLIKTITAFTVAHSITLGIAALGFARVPLAPVNAAIALSVLFLAPEIVRSWRGEESLTLRYPWIVAFLFGLLHGFGFAGGLSTAGMPRAELPFALLFFNVGVELGQLTFVLAAVAFLRSIRPMRIRLPRWVEAVPGYVVGSLGAYWTIQQTAILLVGSR
ncbi:MAG TPA: HupE/UreJ family protein [Candidatus Eisenbacteria bacterium]|nr:HupE/UreJ family protein [Candidatus Eisenbacteria bacterium]